MIKPTIHSIPYLQLGLNEYQYLIKSRILIRWNLQSQLVIYRFDISNKYVEDRISLQPISLKFDSKLQFIETNQACHLLGSELLEDKFTIFILDLEKKELLYIQEIDLKQAKQFGINYERPNTQIYKLEKDFKVIDITEFPNVQEYTLTTNVQSFEILYLEDCELLKLKIDSINRYYVLPLTKTSQPIKYNEKMRNIIFLKDQIKVNTFWNNRAAQISQIYFYHNQLRVGHYFKQPIHKKYLFTRQFAAFFDSKDTLKIYQIRPKSRILRSFRNINGIDNFIGSRILCQMCEFKIIYDFATGQHFEVDVPKEFEMEETAEGLRLYQSFLIEKDLINLNLTYVIEEKKKINL